MIRAQSARLFSLAIFVAAAACGGGGDDSAEVKTGGDFIVLKTQPSDNGTLFLNDAIQIDFSQPVDLASVNLTTFTFEVRDQIGNVVAEPVAGRFDLATSPGDAEVGRRLRFLPKLPTNDLFTNGGFRPGRTYTVQLVGGATTNGTVLRDQRGKGLAQPISFRFSTADGTTPGQLFRNPAAGGPRRTGFEITPTPDQTGVVLNKLGLPAVEVRLRFDQPLNPASTNVPVAVVIDPVTRNDNNRGRIFLEYNDPELGANTWIPAEVELEENSFDSSTVVLRPLGVLPNNATINAVVELTLEDISGESNFNSSLNRVFGTFRTKRSYEQQFDAVVDDFLDSAAVDLTAAFAEPVAEVGPGYIKAGFAYEGSVTGAEFEPEAPQTILNTNFTLVTPKNGSPYNVSGGVFSFRNVKIPAGKTVIGQGSNPMVWLVTGTFEVAGKLSVRGGDGTKVTTSGNANVPKPGGIGVCGGGNGGAGSPSTIGRDLAGGGIGNGPLQVAGLGGLGGQLGCESGCNRGSGGGGGSMATQGDPFFKQKTVPPLTTPPPQVNTFEIFPQQQGNGGRGCLGIGGNVTRNLVGAAPGPIVFTDARVDNNYWGVGVRFDGGGLRITGELSVPIGGGGGGGGGDLSFNNCDPDVNFASDYAGGGGGGGGGALIVKALGPIIIAEGGQILADGGHGGGGEQNGSSTKGAGGGGGAGGMVVLMSATRIDINVRGSNGKFRYGGTAPDTNDFDFSISADGGVCLNGNFALPNVPKKYNPNPTNGVIEPSFATSYDLAPLGGFGGMGVVQLMAPPGTNSDGTNTVLDDNIRIFRAGVLQEGATAAMKQSLIAWRGFPNQIGQGVDDAGNVITIGENDGDIRPAPILLPVPFANKTRLRSTWIDTGSTKRVPVTSSVERPRAIDVLAGQVGPRYEFTGTDPATGYANYALQGSSAFNVYPIVVPSTQILTANSNSTLLGQPAYRVDLINGAMGAIVDRFSQYEAELLDSGDLQVGSFRILSHTDREVVLATEAGPFPASATKLRVRAKLFNITTAGNAGLGGTYLGSSGLRVPIANVRIGFAFHQDPSDPLAQRFPAGANQFCYDLTDPAVQETVRLLGAAFVQWDVLFDTAFKAAPADTPPVLSPDTPRPQVEFLRLPFRF